MNTDSRVGPACAAASDNDVKPSTNGNGQEPGGAMHSAATADWLARAYDGARPPEAVRMLMAIARGSHLGPDDSWFGPGQGRYTWEWLAGVHGVEPSGTILADSFRGPREWFARLDRNRDGRLVADDFDWSNGHPFPQQSYLTHRMFRNINVGGNGRLTRDEWLAFFDRVAEGGDYLAFDALRDGLLSGLASNGPTPDAPTPEMLVRGFFQGELGSMKEGPQVGETAADFVLSTHDGRETVRLSERCGTKPMVLVFGNITCPPFRALFGAVNEQARRYSQEASFLAVYGRESHPVSGWALNCNCQARVDVAQPRTFEERTALARQCHDRLRMNMPLLVDELSDAVSYAYSGMPCRLYVLGPDRRVIYKSGRGPFGFRPDEMEQALLMALLDARLPS